MPEIRSTREITLHKVEGKDLSTLEHIEALPPGPDYPADSYAYQYEIRVGADPALYPSYRALINFQRGPLQEAGPNGGSSAGLIAILIDHLEGMNRGDLASADTAQMITHLRAALELSHKRTRDRIARGVEGTSKV